MIAGAAYGSTHHAHPGGEVIVIGDAPDLAVPHLEEGANAQAIALAIRFWQALIGGLILATDDELGGGAMGITAGEDDQILDLLVLTAVHSCEEGAEGVLAKPLFPFLFGGARYS